MNTNFQYDPEDIESLLMHKQFNELYEDERKFVLQHIESEEEYDSLRKTLFELHDIRSQELQLEPDPLIKTALMAEFARERKKGFWIWLNAYFTLPTFNITIRRYAFVFASLAVLIGVLLFTFNHKQTEEFAENDIIKGSTPSQENVLPNNIDTASRNNLFAENISSEKMPVAPQTLNVATNVQHLEDISESDTEAPSADLSQSKSIVIDDNAKEALTEESDVIKIPQSIDQNADNTVAKKAMPAVESTSAYSVNESIRSGSIELKKDKNISVATTSRNAAEVSDILDILYTAY